MNEAGAGNANFQSLPPTAARQCSALRTLTDTSYMAPTPGGDEWLVLASEGCDDRPGRWGGGVDWLF